MGPLLPGLGSLHKNHPLLPPALLEGLLRVYCTPCAFTKAKTAGMEGRGESLLSAAALRHHGLVFPTHFLACPGPGEVQQGGTCSFCTAASTPSAHTFPKTAFQARKVWQGTLRAILTLWISVTSLFTLMLLGVISKNSHTLPPTWYVNNLEKLLWAIILKWPFWVMLVQAPLWEAGTQCLSLSLRASWSNMLVLATGFKSFCSLICIWTCVCS